MSLRDDLGAMGLGPNHPLRRELELLEARAEAAEADLIHSHETADIYLARAEAAEAERDGIARRALESLAEQMARAEAAEAEAADLNDQLQDALGAEGTHWARITEALKLHQPSQGMCETCGTDYPCLTRRALLGGLDA